VVIGQRSAEYDHVFTAGAEELRSRLIFAEEAWKVNAVEHFDDDNQHYSLTRMRDERGYELDIDLLGDYQRHNILTTCAAADFLAEETPLTISRRAFRQGLASAAASTGLAGRWQVLEREPYTVCDTGHNADGMKYVAAQLEALECEKLYCVIGFAKEKDLNKIMALLPRKAHYIFTRAQIERARNVEDIAAVADSLGLDYECATMVREAVLRAKSLASANDAIFIGGSNFVVAEI
jgi:dihydrofolate synthase/folylpolyglutamate synthase